MQKKIPSIPKHTLDQFLDSKTVLEPDDAKDAADDILGRLSQAAKNRLRAIAIEHGQNRKARRASSKIIAVELRRVDRARARAGGRQEAKTERFAGQVVRMSYRAFRGKVGPLPGMSEERLIELTDCEVE